MKIAISLAGLFFFTFGNLKADYLDYKKTKVIAIQNKAFTLKHELRLNPTFIPFDPYTRGVGIGFSYSYHFSDTMAWDLFDVAAMTGFETSLRSDLVKNYDADTKHFKEVKYILSTSLRYTPLYYKSVLLNSLILHGHGFLMLGFSVLRVNELTATAVSNEGFKYGNNLGFGINMLTAHDIVLSLLFKDHMYWDDGGVTQVMVISLGFGVNFGKSETKE